MKGFLSHWQVRLAEMGAQKGYGSKFAILLGDLYHTKAYFITAHLGSNKLCQNLAVIEENFAKIPHTLEFDQQRG